MNTAHVTQSQDELFNQEFFQLATKMKPPLGPFTFDYKGFWGCDSHCTIEIIGNLVVCTEDTNNDGTSVTNLAEHIATRICYQFQLDPEKLVWVEHYPARGYQDTIPPTWDLAVFQRATPKDGITRLLKPKWSHLGQEGFQRLRTKHLPSA